MVQIFTILKPLVRLVMKFYGMAPQTIEIEPGTVMKIWAPSNKSKAQSKPAVVFLHGFAADGIFSWLAQVQAFAGNYAVYVPDLLFFGGSTTDKPGRSPAFQAEFVAKGLSQLGVKCCTVVGLSYGATVGFKMAELYPELVELVVGSDTVYELTESIWRGSLSKYGYNSLPEFLLPTTVESLQAFLAIANHKPPSMPGFVAKGFIAEFFSNRKERAELLDAWVIPEDQVKPISLNQKVYLVWGDDDKIFNSEVAETTKRQLGGDTTLQFIKDGGHVVQQEKSDVYNEELKKILASFYSNTNKQD